MWQFEVMILPQDSKPIPAYFDFENFGKIENLFTKPIVYKYRRIAETAEAVESNHFHASKRLLLSIHLALTVISKFIDARSKI